MLESALELLGGLFFDRPDFTDRLLYRRLDGCGLTSGQPRKRY
jgi:hypothetical protein